METTLRHINDRQVDWLGRSLLYFGGCDYLRLSRHPEVLSALQSSSLKEGHVSVSASRTTTGNHALYESLEAQLAAFIGSEASLLTGAGYLSNLALASYFKQHATHLILDSKAHSSLKDAAKLSGCQCHHFQHGCTMSATEVFHQLGSPEKAFVLTDGVFGLDGRLAPLASLHASLPEYVGLVIDDAHGFGVLGPLGQGSGAAFHWGERPIIRTVSLAKTLGCHGGAIAGKEQVIHEITTTSEVWSAHTPFPLSMAAACLRSLSLLPTLVEDHQRLQDNIKFLNQLLNASNLPCSSSIAFPVVSFICDPLQSQCKQSNIEEIFIEHGIYPSIIRYPGLTRRSLIRLAISSKHQPEDLKWLVSALEHLHAQFGVTRFLLSEQP